MDNESFRKEQAKMSSTASLLVFAIPLSLFCWISNIAFRSFYLDFATTEAPGPWRWVLASVLPLLISVWGLHKKSLSMSGAVAASVVGFLMTITSLCFTTSIIVFFLTSSKATKFRSQKKKQIDVDYKEGGQRNWVQVFCNGSIPATLALVYLIDVGSTETVIDFRNQYVASWLSVAVLGGVACCSGDTWASEFGTVIGRGQPRLITTLKRVPTGTNGGVSIVGLISSLIGGVIVGVTYYLTLLLCVGTNQLSDCPPQWPIIAVGGTCGLLGSLIDSVLGATIQYSGFSETQKCITESPGLDVKHISGIKLLDNHSVNLLSCALTSLIAPPLYFYVLGSVVPSWL